MVLGSQHAQQLHDQIGVLGRRHCELCHRFVEALQHGGKLACLILILAGLDTPLALQINSER